MKKKLLSIVAATMAFGATAVLPESFDQFDITVTAEATTFKTTSIPFHTRAHQRLSRN